jgi:HK97 family phage prohead protease
MMNRAYSLIQIKAVENEDARVISGVATTPEPDRQDDIIEPKGAEFNLPIPLLWQHDSKQPIGKVIKAKVTADGIDVTAQIAKITEPGRLKDRVDEAWQSIKSGLVGGLSIGFKALETAQIEGSFGTRFLRWLWLELSAVTIAANQQATIVSIKSNDAEMLRAASGPVPHPAVVRLSPGVSGKSVLIPKPPKEGKVMDTYAKHITELEGKRAAHVAAQDAVMQKSRDEGRTTDQSEQEKFDNLQAELEAIDQDLDRYRKLEKTMAATAKPVIGTKDDKNGIEVRSSISVAPPPKLEPGIGYARLVKVKMAAKLTGDPPLLMAQRMYGPDSEVVGIITKANEVVAGTTISGNWAADLISAEGAAVAFFLEYLRPQTILGKFGVGGVPSLTMIDFYTPYVIETGAGAAYWVGEGKPKPLTAFDYDRSTLTPLKVANIAVLTEENIRYSSPNSDRVVRNALVKAIAQELDLAFITPANAGTANVKPASVTNGAEAIVSSGDDADAIRMDVRSLYQKFIDANNAPTSGAWVMSATNALALSMLTNPLGQPEFPTVTMTGGTFQGLPVIASQHISNVVAIINASDILLGDEGGVSVDMSRDASIEMRSSGLGMDATTGAATVGSVSMFQTNSVALRAERTINWKRARVSAVAYLTSVDWGGAVNTV